MATEEPRNPELQAAEDEYVRLATDEAYLNMLSQVRPASELLQADIDAYLGYEAPPAPVPAVASVPDPDDPLPPALVSAVKAAKPGPSGVVRRVSTPAEREAQQVWLKTAPGWHEVRPYRAHRALPWWTAPLVVLWLAFVVSLVTGR